MDLTPSPEQRLLDEVARAFVAREYPLERIPALADRDGRDDRGGRDGRDGFDVGLWRAVAQLGWPGLLVAEEHGGTAAGAALMGTVCEALGRGCVPTPLEASGVAAVVAIAGAGDDAQRARWLPQLAAGTAVGTFALVEPGMSDEWSVPSMRGGATLSGTKVLVPWAGVADVLVVATIDGLHLVETAGPAAGRIRIEPHRTLGGDPLASVELDGAAAERLGGDGGRTADVVARVLDHVTVARLAHVVGVAEGALELTLAHARDRHQFGRPIGSFQAVAHRCVDMRADLDACRFLTHQAAWALDRGGPADLEVAAAKAYANEAVRRILQHAHQVHGAIGFSSEHPLHLFTRRAKAFELSWGSTARHHERLAAAMGLR